MQFVVRSVLSVCLALLLTVMYLGTPDTVLSNNSLAGAPIILSCLMFFGLNLQEKLVFSRVIVGLIVLLGMGVANGGAGHALAGLALSLCALFLVFWLIILPNKLLILSK